MLLGAHVSIAGGVSQAFRRAAAIGATAMQIFTKNANQWRAAPLPGEEIEAFAAARQEGGVAAIIAHDSYLINLAAADGENRSRSLAAFLDEMRRCAALGIDHLVMHPGAHLDAGEDIGLRRIAEAFRIIFEQAPPQVVVLLENTAGQGSYLGYRFEHLAAIMEQVPQGRFGVCFDTCHAFAAGYDLSSEEGYHRTIAECERIFGASRIAAIHLNDSQKARGSRVDRHAHIGQGAISIDAFAALMRDARFAAVPKILETAPGENNRCHLEELALLRRLAEVQA
ncbi:MAG: deoxyribonuclease IV [Syntrophotalea acetylenica]|jgi:deoxyribonuclease-4|uniref:Probable endonuclease 4 n=1 Tax=Syntrophotalea acetylenica TaxID=29542 RepID=A0A1L3GFN8_SYNAC|nr:deoxyribonuclease IV [Syntrophotalea acetylenica]APG24659.1 deoxyribonuclease IV [Syntrophotalea acetylenica]APG42707.1 deoxyribonuclease IV [Syntrophotalea acetylenica]MDD4458137.1 deoxyribonuclease IV [Syntrophotalea acetylenica]MDY0262181.1 deoxyribonuclease IV [Syntrophotalea acetylenica]